VPAHSGATTGGDGVPVGDSEIVGVPLDVRAGVVDAVNVADAERVADDEQVLLNEALTEGVAS
jgi:hypothetical protein